MSDSRPDRSVGASDDRHVPLAARMRPRRLDEFVGQEHLLAPDRPLARVVAQGRLHSMLFWGPPGTGKTTLARLLAMQLDAEWISLSAVLAGVKDVRAAIDRAREARTRGRSTVLFIDEIHRFNKAQQDAFLPQVEEGVVTLIGATTENPSFEVNNALLSRMRVYVLKRLSDAALAEIVDRALTDTERGLGEADIGIADDARALLVAAADGDARRLLNLLDMAAQLVPRGATLDADTVASVVGERYRTFDKRGDHFYDQISALHKSIRGSAPDAALYWLCRMLDGGCDPLYIARRLLRVASEDVGNADPRALTLTLDAWETYHRLGSPEGELALAQAVVYLASVPKSDAVYRAYNAARADVAATPSYDVPLRLRNAPTGLMKAQGHGQGYRHAHDEPDAYAAGERYFPDEVRDRRYYEPLPHGLEQRIAERLARLRELDDAARGESAARG
jgi:putative ATPase